jgi:hypothetical protein
MLPPHEPQHDQENKTRMRSKIAVFCSLLLGAAVAQAASVSGTVTNKTTGKPSAGDLVELVDVQAGMSAVATAKSDGKGRYSLNEPGSGPYLVRVTHQGAGYFIAAPQGNGPGDIGVYDASPDAKPISIEADVLQMEAQNDQLIVSEHWFVHNTSSPKETKTGEFQFVLPSEAVLDMAESTRPSPMSMPTIAQPKSLGNGRYSLSVPIEPDQGDKNTIFEIQYHLPYKGKFTFHSQVTMPVDNFAVQLPKSMELKGEGSSFQPVQAQQQIAIYLMKNAVPGTPVVFTVTGSGTMPREEQPQGGGPQAGAAPAGGQPGGGIGEPIQAPDPLSKYKWWILGGLALLLAAAAAFLLRKPAGNTGAALPVVEPAYTPVVAQAARPAAPPVSKGEALLNALKEELFSLESERISGTISAAEYAAQKAALETVLKRALNQK